MTSNLAHVQDIVWVATEVKGKLFEHDPVPRDIPMFLPEQLVAFLLTDAGLRINDSHLQKFWEHARDHGLPWASASPDGSHYPLALYGDAAKFNAAGEKVTGIFLSMPLWDPRSARFSRFLLCALETYQVLGMQTLAPIFQKIVDSMWQLYTEGIEVNGRRIKFVTIELRGDWEWHVFALGLIPTWRHDQICWRCYCDKKRHPNFLDFREHPAWKGSERNHSQFLAECIDSPEPGGPSATVHSATFHVHLVVPG
eukprot:Skav233746  [mRNA]  locus=scaffold1792:76570:77331:+ [translate_table: standard]